MMHEEASNTSCSFVPGALTGFTLLTKLYPACATSSADELQTARRSQRTIWLTNLSSCRLRDSALRHAIDKAAPLR